MNAIPVLPRHGGGGRQVRAAWGQNTFQKRMASVEVSEIEGTRERVSNRLGRRRVTERKKD